MADHAEHRISQQQQQHSLPSSPLLRKKRKLARRSRADPYDQSVPLSPSHSSHTAPSTDSESESNREEEEDPLPDKDGQGPQVTVKEAIEGLFYSKAVQLVHHHE